MIANLVHDNGDQMHQHQGIYFQGQKGLVADNVVYGHDGFGIVVRGNYPDPDTTVEIASRRTIVTGNTVVGNSLSGIMVENNAAHTLVVNNISVANGSYAAPFAATTTATARSFPATSPSGISAGTTEAATSATRTEASSTTGPTSRRTRCSPTRRSATIGCSPAARPSDARCARTPSAQTSAGARGTHRPTWGPLSANATAAAGEASGERLGIYFDEPYRVVERGDGREFSAAHPLVLFLVHVGREFASLTLFGHTRRDGTSDPYPVPTPVDLAELGYYSSLHRPAEVAAALPRSISGFWSGLSRVDSVWIIGPHPYALVCMALAAVRRKRILLCVRQDRRVGDAVAAPWAAAGCR